ncbi:MAG: LysR family transcriptional regulator [Halioglobus sp.]
MNTHDLSKADLNLLISLQVLLEEKSVSRAAERLFITQPAMSKTLSRLRLLFNDPLFTRSSHGMQPTPRAQELARDLPSILGSITQLVTGAAFEPSTFAGEITLALSEYIGVALLPELAKTLQTQSPHLSIKVITRVENQLDELALGNLDFAIHIQHAQYGSEFTVHPLGGSPPAILTRVGHPLSQGEVTWQRLAQFPLVRLYVSDWEQLEIQRNAEAVMAMQDHQQGTLEISHLLTALEVLRHTDYFMPAPAYILQNEDATRGITALPVPQSGDFSINYALVAHKRTANSPLHNWLWEQITCTIADLRTPHPRKMRQRVAAGSIDQNQ